MFDCCVLVHLVDKRGAAGNSYDICGGVELTNRELTSPLVNAIRAGCASESERSTDEV